MTERMRRQVFHAYEPSDSRDPDEWRFCPRCGAPCEAGTVSGRPRRRCSACRRVLYRNPAPGVAVVVAEGNGVVLGRRRGTEPGAAHWALPAGFIEFDEDFLTAARRETREETGLEIEVTGILNVTFNYHAPDLHALVVAVAARAVGGALVAGDDLCEVRWFPLSGPWPPLRYEADAELLRLLAAGAVPQLPVDGRYAGPNGPDRAGLGRLFPTTGLRPPRNTACEPCR
jgi:ADP-ribose pyrophosphatase YjhB (NUDIX family)